MMRKITMLVLLLFSALGHGSQSVSQQIGEYLVVFTTNDDGDLDAVRIINNKKVIVNYQAAGEDLRDQSIYVDESLASSLTIRFSTPNKLSGFSFIKKEFIDLVTWDKGARKFIYLKKEVGGDPFRD